MKTPRAPESVPAWARWSLVAITVAAALLRFLALTAEEPWFDEVFSIVLASEDLPGLLRRTIADQTNPPGFYLLFWVWTRLGGFDLAWMRLLPALASAFTVPAVALAARGLRLSWSGAIVAASLAAASPLLVAMSSELRAYAVVALVTALTLAAAANERRVLVALGGVALVMLHYFGALVVAALALGTIWVARDRRAAARSALLTALPAAVALGAWFAVVMRTTASRTAADNASWIGPAGARALTGFATEVVGSFGTPVGEALVALTLLGALAIALARPRRGDGGEGGADGRAAPDPRLAIALAVAPLVLVGVLTALTGRGLWIGRYLIITVPGWCVVLAYATTSARGRWQEAAFVALLTWSSLAGIHAERMRTKKTAWSAIARAISGGVPRAICVNESFVALPLRFQVLATGIPLTVLDMDQCTVDRAPVAIVMRPGTEESLQALERAGAIAGTSRDLGTTLPETRLVPLKWRAR